MTPRHGGRSGTVTRQDYMARALSELAEAALDRSPVAGWTHNFYRYPARFSPSFAAAAIRCFSQQGDLVFDPYMGGGTAVVEGVVAGRRVIGNDLNSLAAFVAKVKVTALTRSEARSIRQWVKRDVPTFTYDRPSDELAAFMDPHKTRNLSLVRARFIKKACAAALMSIPPLPTRNAQDLARCVVLRVAQWALDGRERHTPLAHFRSRLAAVTGEMLASLTQFAARAQECGGCATILNSDAAELDRTPVFSGTAPQVSLIVTSPPYPGVHVLYHRWQVDGRRETPAPYWIAACNDGEGASFYNFGDRRETAADTYFRISLNTLQAIRRVVRAGGYMVQMVAFSKPAEQLQRYLENMRIAGFTEVSINADPTLRTDSRIWRTVPHRKWHAALNGRTHSSNEVVLVHRAV